MEKYIGYVRHDNGSVRIGVWAKDESSAREQIMRAERCPEGAITRIEILPFDYERTVLVAADSWKQLRRSSVYRLFDSHDMERWSGIYKCLKAHRTDLVDEAREVMADLEADAHSSTKFN